LKKIIKDIFGFVISMSFFYFLFTNFLYTILFIAIILIFIGLNVYYVAWKIQNSLLINTFKNNSDYAKAMFRWNILARAVFENVLDKQKEKLEKLETIDKDCYSILKITVYSKKKEIKDAWKILAKKYHPDNYQDDREKEKAEEIFKDITKCKDELIRRVNV